MSEFGNGPDFLRSTSFLGHETVAILGCGQGVLVFWMRGEETTSNEVRILKLIEELKKVFFFRFCLTFVEKDAIIRRNKTAPFFGRCICFQDETDLLKWLTTVTLSNVSKI